MTVFIALGTSGCELLADVRGQRGLQAPSQGGQAHHDHQEERDGLANPGWSVSGIGDYVPAGAHEGRGRVPGAAADHLDGAASDQVNEHSAPHGRRHADEDRRYVGQVVEQGLLHADDREQANRHRVEDGECPLEPAHEAGEQEPGQGRGSDRRQKVAASDGNRPQPKQQVTHYPAAKAHDHGEQERSEGVQLLPCGGTRAGQGPGDHRGQVDPQGHLQRMNHRCLAYRRGGQALKISGQLHSETSGGPPRLAQPRYTAMAAAGTAPAISPRVSATVSLVASLMSLNPWARGLPARAVSPCSATAPTVRAKNPPRIVTPRGGRSRNCSSVPAANAKTVAATNTAAVAPVSPSCGTTRECARTSS